MNRVACAAWRLGWTKGRRSGKCEAIEAGATPQADVERKSGFDRPVGRVIQNEVALTLGDAHWGLS
jgi:hypothetical protein